MQATVVSACLAALLLAGCSGSGSSSSAERKCPVPVHYSKEQYDEKVEELGASAGRLFALERQIYDAQTADGTPDSCQDFHL